MDPILLAVTEIARIGNISTMHAAYLLSQFLSRVSEHQDTHYERDILQALSRSVASLGDRGISHGGNCTTQQGASTRWQNHE